MTRETCGGGDWQAEAIMGTAGGRRHPGSRMRLERESGH